MSVITAGAVDIDVERLRADRRHRLAAAMNEHGLDVLVLGRPANVAYASGAHQLWTAGSRPFGPACIVVAETGRTHLLSTWDEGVPPEIGHDELFGLSWNPANLLASLQAIPGLAGARRVGTDSLSPGFSRLLAGVARDAEVVDGRAAVLGARSTKTTDEVACITAATAVAEAGLSAMVDDLRPGVTERDLLATSPAAISVGGAPTPPTAAGACATPRHGAVRLRRLPTDRAIAAGELVVLDAGGMHLGYEGGVGRTWRAGEGPATPAQRDLAARGRAALDAVLEACRPGATGADLVAAWTATGEALPPVPLVHGCGLGVEPPLVGAAGLGADATLVAGNVVSVTSWVAADGVGGSLERETVLVTDAGAEVLSRYGRGPAGEGS